MSHGQTHHSTHSDWLQLLQPQGLVVTPIVLEQFGYYLDRNISDERALFDELLSVT